MKLRILLGDQLNLQHSWFSDVNDDVLFVLMEVQSEAQYVRHHIQKVVAFFASMRHFAQDLQNKGHKVHYIKLSEAENKQSVSANLLYLAKKFDAEKLEYLLPDEYRLDREMQNFAAISPVPVEAFDTEHFLTRREDLSNFFDGKKGYLMESFYRMMRKKYHILMNGAEPLGGKWNFDHENRNAFPANYKAPKSLLFQNGVEEIVEEIKQMQVQTIGALDGNVLSWPINSTQAEALLDHFCEHHLAHFGTYQDVMDAEDPFLNHSRLSFSLNTKMLHPLKVVEKVLDYWMANKSSISLAQCEGFVRQIIGWREYMRGVYWAKMPEYAHLNYFGHTNNLPSFFWDGKTKMNCLSKAIGQSLKYGYAHHIQRLMITGNFALLAGIDPSQVDEWYLGIYVDAIEWVEITNTRGMSQFADGGIVGTKPYVSSANYIQKMSNYCGTCFYKHNQKTGENACPFNSLYWHFYERNRDKLERNPRIGFVYPSLDKMNRTAKTELMDRAEYILQNLDSV
jgi:deoxyribodipyrimidine photolyase-related protein